MQNQMKEQVECGWATHVESWRQSGLSQSAYCRQEGISNKKFHYHLHRLRNEECKPELSFIEAKPIIKSAVTTKPEAKASIRLILPNGVQALLEDISFDLLPQVFGLASNLSC